MARAQKIPKGITSNPREARKKPVESLNGNDNETGDNIPNTSMELLTRASTALPSSSNGGSTQKMIKNHEDDINAIKKRYEKKIEEKDNAHNAEIKRMLKSHQAELQSTTKQKDDDLEEMSLNIKYQLERLMQKRKDDNRIHKAELAEKDAKIRDYVDKRTRVLDRMHKIYQQKLQEYKQNIATLQSQHQTTTNDFTQAKREGAELVRKIQTMVEGKNEDQIRIECLSNHTISLRAQVQFLQAHVQYLESQGRLQNMRLMRLTNYQGQPLHHQGGIAQSLQTNALIALQGPNQGYTRVLARPGTMAHGGTTGSQAPVPMMQMHAVNGLLPGPEPATTQKTGPTPTQSSASQTPEKLISLQPNISGQRASPYHGIYGPVAQSQQNANTSRTSPRTPHGLPDIYAPQPRNQPPNITSTTTNASSPPHEYPHITVRTPIKTPRPSTTAQTNQHPAPVGISSLSSGNQRPSDPNSNVTPKKRALPLETNSKHESPTKKARSTAEASTPRKATNAKVFEVVELDD